MFSPFPGCLSQRQCSALSPGIYLSASAQPFHYIVNNIDSLKRTLQYYYHAAPLGLHGNSTEGFLLRNLYCLECRCLSERECLALSPGVCSASVQLFH